MPGQQPRHVGHRPPKPRWGSPVSRRRRKGPRRLSTAAILLRSRSGPARGGGIGPWGGSVGKRWCPTTNLSLPTRSPQAFQSGTGDAQQEDSVTTTLTRIARSAILVSILPAGSWCWRNALMQTRPAPGKAGSGPPTQLSCARKPASRLTCGQRDAGEQGCAPNQPSAA